MLHKFEVSEAPDDHIINCSEDAIKCRAENWIVNLKYKDANKRILVSDMADTTKFQQFEISLKDTIFGLVVLIPIITLMRATTIRKL